MIYYFSGTGNSRWVAETLAEKTGDTTTRIVKRTVQPLTVHAGETFGIVFPIYAWNMPRMVQEFIDNIFIEKGAYTFAVCTCGSEAGCAMRVLHAKMPMDSMWSLVMPDNYVVAFHAESEERSLEKVRAAAAKLDAIADCIREKKSGERDVQTGSLPFLKTFVAGHLFRRYALSAKPFRSTYACSGCGLCEKECPTENIRVADGMPFWFDTCEQCMACIQRCPKKAIEYGRSTEKHGRYAFHYTAEEIYGQEKKTPDEV